MTITPTFDRAGECEVFDDFFALNTALWTSVDDGATGSEAVADAAGGRVNLPTAAADNDYNYLASAGEHFLFSADKPLRFAARVKLSEANTDDANIIIGLSDTVSAGILQDNGAGPAASYDGAVWFKVDGGTVWQFETSNAGSQVTNSSAGAFTSGADVVLGFQFDPQDGVTGRIVPFFNGVAGTPHLITISGLEEMHVILGVKAGGANAETLSVDYVWCRQAR